MAADRPTALVTAGGTREPIDAVRAITNTSTGRFGAAIALALADRGVRTTLLGSEALLSARPELAERMQVAAFGSFADLSARLAEHLAAAPPDLVFMAAAVSDYSPVPYPGKIPSEAEEIGLRLRRNPKLLDSIRARGGEGAFVVGFKLLAGSSREELLAAARRQIERARTDLVVANELSDLSEDAHPVVLVAPGVEPIDVRGPRAAVAASVVERALDGAAAKMIARGATDRMRHAASACVIDAAGRVLLGRRRRGALEGWWAFPGGEVEAGETALEAARRELREETGVEAPAGEPRSRHCVHASAGPDGPLWAIECFVLQTRDAAEPRETDELSPRWVALDEATGLAPITPGTARVLRLLQPTA